MHEPAKTRTEYFVLLLTAAYDGTFPSVNEADGRCLYRSGFDANSPCRCAAGLQIPDDKYNPEMDGESTLNAFIAPNLVKRWPDVFIIPEGMTLENIDVIQKAHDRLSSNWDALHFIGSIIHQKFWVGTDLQAGLNYLKSKIDPTDSHCQFSSAAEVVQNNLNTRTTNPGDISWP